MDIIFYHLVILVFIVIVYLLFIKKDKVEDEDEISIHNDEDNTCDTMLELKNKNDILEEKVNRLEKELSNYKEAMKKVDKLSNQVDTLDGKMERMINENADIQNGDMDIKIKNGFTITYFDENKYRRLERSLRKYNMLAYKKLVFEYYPNIKNGNFIGKRISKKNEHILKYELKLPTDALFFKVHGDFKLIYSVNIDEKTIVIETIEPENILLDGYKDALPTYKGVMISKNNPEKDMFKINLLNMLNNDNERKDK